MRLPKYLLVHPAYLIAAIAVCAAAIVYAPQFSGGGAAGGQVDSTEIRPMPGEISLTSNGIFTGVFVNRATSPLKVREFWLVDKSNREMKCGAFEEVLLPPGESFKASIDSCGARNPGEEYTLEVRINYDKSEGGKMRPQVLYGELSGTVE